MLGSFLDAKSRILSGNQGCLDLVRTFLQKIEQHKNLNAFISVFRNGALGRAKAIDERIANNEEGSAAGLVVSIKDTICYADHRVSAASSILQSYRSPYSATALQRLVDEDAVIIGRVNCDEFAMGSTNETSALGSVHNPLDFKRIPGGSSGGSAVSVAAGMCHVSLGSDTGGSIRQPASHCGVWGLKPSYGLVSRYGLIAYASSLDQISITGSNAADLDFVLSVIAGKDVHDATTIDPAFAPVPEQRPLKLAFWNDALEYPALHPDIKRHLKYLMKKLAGGRT